MMWKAESKSATAIWWHSCRNESEIWRCGSRTASTRLFVRRRANLSSDRDEGDSFDHNSSRHLREFDKMRTENEEFRRQLQERDQLLIQREDQAEALADHAEDIQRRRASESIERSENRAQILEEREECVAVEDDLNAVRDRLASATIELQQNEDKLDLKNREIDDLIQEHNRVVEVVEQEWRGEVEEARSQVEELRDVRFLAIFLPFCVSFSLCYMSLPGAKTQQENYDPMSRSSKPTPTTSMRSLKLPLHTSSRKRRTTMLSSVPQTRRSSSLASKYMPWKRMQIV